MEAVSVKQKTAGTESVTDYPVTMNYQLQCEQDCSKQKCNVTENL